MDFLVFSSHNQNIIYTNELVMKEYNCEYNNMFSSDVNDVVIDNIQLKDV